MRGTRRSWARRARNSAIALLPAVVVISMFAATQPAGARLQPDDTTSPDIFLVITKTADASPVVAGNQIGFKITLQHSGSFPVNDVSLTDTLPVTPGTSWSIDSGGTTGWGSTCGITGGVLTCGGTGTTFNNDDSAVVHIVSGTTLATCDPAIGAVVSTVVNTASYYGTPSAGGPVADSSTASLQVTCPLTLTKVADSPTVTAGNTIGFTITATNDGSAPIGPVVINDPLSSTGFSWSIAHQDGTACDDPIVGGNLHCEIPSLAAGAHYSVHVISPTTTDDCGEVINIATAYIEVADGNVGTTDQVVEGQDETSAEATINVSCLTLSKSPDHPTVSAGDGIGFTITAKNIGGSAIPVHISDPLPTDPGLTWTIDATGGTDGGAECEIVTQVLTCDVLPLGAGVSYAVHVISPTTSDTCGTVDNTASATTGVVGDVLNRVNLDQQEPTVTATATVTVQCANLSITKTPDLYRGVPGKKMSWTITVENHGPGTAHDVVMNDLLHFGGPYSVDDTNHCYIHIGPDVLVCEFGDMAPGASFTVHLTAVLSSISDCGEIRNVASVEAIGVPLIFSSPAITNVSCPNVSVVKTAEYGSVQHPSRGFQIVTSAAGGTLKNVKLSDPLASGAKWTITGGDGKSKCKIAKGHLTCSFGTMKSGKSFTVHIKATQVPCVPIDNTATVSATNEPSFEAGDNTATAHVGCVI